MPGILGVCFLPLLSIRRNARQAAYCALRPMTYRIFALSTIRQLDSDCRVDIVFLLPNIGGIGFRSAWANDRAVCPPYQATNAPYRIKADLLFTYIWNYRIHAAFK